MLAPVDRIDGHSNAGGYLDRTRPDDIRHRQLRANLSRGKKCALIVRNFRQQNDELVTALTTRRIASSDAGQQARGNSLEQLVARRVPECVIDGFEAVKVEIEQRELRPHPRRLRHRLVKAIKQQEAIGKTGERIEVSPPMRLCVRSLEQA